MGIKLLSMVVAVYLAACQSPPTTAPTTAPADNSTDPVDNLLTRLEASARDLTSFTSQIVYEKEDALLGRREIRTGNLIYRKDVSSGKKRFAMLFDYFIVDNRRRLRNEHYVFDGRWLAEINHEDKQFIKREIVPPGKELDPLKLGQGPFPLPIDQSKDDVLARFDATIAAVPTDGRLSKLETVEGLRLIPKAESAEAEDFKSVLIFYDTETLLPVGIEATESNGDIKTVVLTDARRNPSLTEQELKNLDISDPDPREWRIDIRPWSSGE